MAANDHPAFHSYQDRAHWGPWVPLADWLQQNKVAWTPDMEPLEGFLYELLTPGTAYALACAVHQQWRQAVQAGKLRGDPALPELACFEHQPGEVYLGIVLPEPWDGNVTTATWADESFSSHEDPDVRELWAEFKKLRDR